MDRPQCRATAKSTGERCKRTPIPGGTVCVKHGGRAPQVQLKAATRLAALRDEGMALLALQIRKTVKCIEENNPQLVSYVTPTVVARMVKDFSELVETMEGRAGNRWTHEFSGPGGGPIQHEHHSETELDREIGRLLGDMAHAEEAILGYEPAELPRGFEPPLRLGPGPEAD